MNQAEYVCQATCETTECRFLEAFNSWFITDDLERIFSVLTEDIQWEMVGEVPFDGIDAVKRSFAETPERLENPVKRLVVERIYTDSNGGVSEGHMTMRDGSVYRFADVVTFADTGERRIRSLKAYLIPIGSEATDSIS